MTNNTLLLYHSSPYHKQAREQYLTPLSTGIVTLQTKRKGTPGRSRNRGLTPVSILFMAVKYQLVQMRDMSKGALEGAKLYYAQAISNGTMTFDELCEDVAETCTLTSADVKAVLDRINYILDKNLRAGRIVQMGEMGNFRMAVGSTGSATPEEFSADQIKTPRIVFSPGSKLRGSRKNTKFERFTINAGSDPDAGV